jgi:hypothetical protein
VHVDISNWIEFLDRLFAGTKIRHFGLVVHWYIGGIETERIKFKDRVKVAVAHLTPDTLLEMDEDVIYDVQR